MNYYDNQIFENKTFGDLYAREGPFIQINATDLGIGQAFFFIPVFALFNAGVRIEGNIIAMIFHPVSIGIIAGLVLGKFLGISIFSHLIIKMKVAVLPDGVSFRDIYGAALLAGIGFTMSIFISDLAFSDQQLVQVAKVGIFTASIISAVLGVIILTAGKDPGN